MLIRRAAFAAGPLLAALIWWADLFPGLSLEGRHALALTAFAVTWWAGGVTAPVWTTLALLLGYVALGVAQPETVFGFLVTPLFWLMLSAFLMAGAMEKSGLAERLAYAILVRFGGGYRSLVVLAYAANLLLSPLVPIPFPRALLIMAVMDAVLRRAGATPTHRAWVGFAVFVSSTSTSAVLLTGDAVLNLASLQVAGVAMTWLEWARHMAVPGLVMAALSLLAHLMVFRPAQPLAVDLAQVRTAAARLGPIKPAEWRTLLFVGLALLLWATDALHGIHPAWVGLGAVLALALPLSIGEPVLTTDDLVQRANLPILIFVAGAAALGAVARVSGLADYLGAVLLPEAVPASPFLFGLMVALITMAGHLFLGSSLSTMAVVLPLLIQFGERGGWPPTAVMLMVYSAVALQFILPHQSVPVLIGAGSAGGYSHRETLRFALPLTLLVCLLVGVVEPLWWRVSGLLP